MYDRFFFSLNVYDSFFKRKKKIGVDIFIFLYQSFKKKSRKHLKNKIKSIIAVFNYVMSRHFFIVFIIEKIFYFHHNFVLETNLNSLL